MRILEEEMVGTVIRHTFTWTVEEMDLRWWWWSMSASFKRKSRHGKMGDFVFAILAYLRWRKEVRSVQLQICNYYFLQH